MFRDDYLRITNTMTTHNGARKNDQGGAHRSEKCHHTLVVFTVTHRDNKCFKTRSEVLMFEYSLPETFYDLNVILNNQLVLKYLLKSMFSLKTYHWDVLHVETTFDVNYF